MDVVQAVSCRENLGGGGSALARAKKIAGQITNAKIEGKKRKAAVIEIVWPDGSVRRLYWNGASYGDRPSSMAAKYSDMNGTYRVNIEE